MRSRKCRLPCAAILCALSVLNREMLLLQMPQGLHLSAALPAFGNSATADSPCSPGWLPCLGGSPTLLQLSCAAAHHAPTVSAGSNMLACPARCLKPQLQLSTVQEPSLLPRWLLASLSPGVLGGPGHHPDLQCDQARCRACTQLLAWPPTFAPETLGTGSTLRTAAAAHPSHC